MNNMILVCPVCKAPLCKQGNSLKCENSHSFDYSKEGYVNLLLGTKSGDKTGDSKESARARRSLLSKGYYKILKDFICERLEGTVLDICCGEGYYDSYDGQLYGFDISKEMVRLASKLNKACNYFVANLSSIPIKDEAIDTAIHLFAPFNENEFYRVMKKGGRLYSVIGGENHLYQLKAAVYDEPYKNDERPPETNRFKLANTYKISENVIINQQDLKELFSMTPYYYRTSQADKNKLDMIDTLELTVEFVILEYVK